MKQRTPARPYIHDEGPYHIIYREVASREYHCYCPRDVYIGSVGSLFEAERKVEATRYDLIQAGLIGAATLHMDAAA